MKLGGIMEMKKCEHCGIEKTLDNFTSGRKPYKDVCDECKAEIMLRKQRERDKKYSQKNKDKVNEHNRNYARRNREKINQYNREYKRRIKENETPEQKEVRLKKQRERMKKKIENETPEQREKRLNYMREARIKRLAKETEEQKEARLMKNREKLKRDYEKDPERFKKYRERYFAKNPEKKEEKIQRLRNYLTNKSREQERFNKLLAETMAELQIN